MAAPEIRLDGFYREWNEVTFSSLATLRRGLTYKPSDRVEMGRDSVRLLRSSNIQDGLYHPSVDDAFVKRNAATIEYLQSGDILITASNGSPHLVGKHAIVNLPPEEEAVHGGFMLAARAEHPLFVNALMGANWYHKFLSSFTAGGGGAIGNLNSEQLAAQEVAVPPTLDEQHAIGRFFDDIDTSLQDQQTRLTQLRHLKQTMLTKMFPRDGETEPEVRLDGFVGEWRREKVGKYYEFKNGLNKGKEFFGYGVPIVNFTDVFHKRGLTSKDISGRVSASPDEIRSLQVQKGDIFFTRTSETIEEVGMPSIFLDQPEHTIFSGFVLRGRAINSDPLDNLFKTYAFFAKPFRSEMTQKSSMTTRALTSGTALKSMYFNFPSDISEQRAIGAYFTKLDQLIELEDSMLTKLQQLKAAFLDKMFV